VPKVASGPSRWATMFLAAVELTPVSASIAAVVVLPLLSQARAFLVVQLGSTVPPPPEHWSLTESAMRPMDLGPTQATLSSSIRSSKRSSSAVPKVASWPSLWAMMLPAAREVRPRSSMVAAVVLLLLRKVSTAWVTQGL